MFNYIKNLFHSKKDDIILTENPEKEKTISEKKSVKEEPKTTVEEKNKKKQTSVIYHHNERYLKLKDNDCALILHEEDQGEIVFTRLYDKEHQNFTPNENLLMALAMYLKQPGFGEMLINEFHRLAEKNANKLFQNNEEVNKK